MFRAQILAIRLYNKNFRGVYKVQGGKCKCEISQVWGVWRAWLVRNRVWTEKLFFPPYCTSYSYGLRSRVCTFMSCKASSHDYFISLYLQMHVYVINKFSLYNLMMAKIDSCV
jgi:hypothetical protein